MPQSRSAKKDVRQNAKRRAVNHWRKRRIKEQSKSFLDAIASKDVALAETEYSKYCGLIDKFLVQARCTRILLLGARVDSPDRLKELKQHNQTSLSGPFANYRFLLNVQTCANFYEFSCIIVCMPQSLLFAKRDHRRDA